MQSESTCFKNYKNGQKKKGSQRTYQPMTKRKKKMCEPFFSYEIREGEKSTQRQTCNLFFELLKKEALFMRVLYVGVLAGGGAARR